MLIDHSHIQQLAQHILLILMDTQDGTMSATELCTAYEASYGESLILAEVCTDLMGYVEVCVISFFISLLIYDLQSED